MQSTADAVVIGGGVMGASAAHFLAKKGFGKVVLLEKRTLAAVSTGHSAANVRTYYSNPETVKLAWRAVQMFENDRDSIQVVAWRDWAKKNNVGFVDLFPAFLDAGSPADVLSRFFIPFDIHWNAAGHGFVARRLLTHRAMRRPVFKLCQDQRKPATR